jgi:hypothetical protein
MWVQNDHSPASDSTYLLFFRSDLHLAKLVAHHFDRLQQAESFDTRGTPKSSHVRVMQEVRGKVHSRYLLPPS